MFVETEENKIYQSNHRCISIVLCAGLATVNGEECPCDIHS
jgi:hypothetical protein